MDEDESYRATPWRERLSHAWFLYSFLEMSDRYGLGSPKFSTATGWLDRAIEASDEDIRRRMQAYWSSVHGCEKEGCGYAFIRSQIYDLSLSFDFYIDFYIDIFQIEI
jgi:hypothetical protein